MKTKEGIHYFVKTSVSKGLMWLSYILKQNMLIA